MNTTDSVISRSLLLISSQGDLEEKGECPKQKCVSQVMKNALPGMQHPDLQTREAFRQIAQLQVSSIQDHSKKTCCPDEFLKVLGFSQNPNKPFLMEDIIEIYRIIKAHPLSCEIPFSTLFGLECFEILNEMEKKGIISATHVTVWLGRYLKNCIANFALQGINKDDFTKTVYSDFNKFDTFMKIRQSLINTTDVMPLLKKWENTQKILKLFFFHPQSHDLLKTSICKCPGKKEYFELTTIQDLKSMRFHLNSHMDFINKSILALNAHRPELAPPRQIISLFKKLSQKIELQNSEFAAPLSQKINKINLENLKKHFKSVVNYISFKANIFGVGIQPKSIDPWSNLLTEYFTTELMDIHKIIHYSILGFIDPMHDKKIAYENRLLVLLEKLNKNCNKFLEKQEYNNNGLFTDASSNKNSACADMIKAACDELMSKIISLQTELKDIIWGINRCHSDYLVALPFISSKIEVFTNRLKPLTELAAKQLYEIGLTHFDELHDLSTPLLQLTKALACAFVAVHDMEMMTKEHCDWPCELPLDFICFLHLQNMKKNPSIRDSSPEVVREIPEFTTTKSFLPEPTLHSSAQRTSDLASGNFNLESNESFSDSMPRALSEFDSTYVHQESAPSSTQKTKKNSKLTLPKKTVPVFPKRIELPEEPVCQSRLSFLEQAKSITRRGITWNEIEGILKQLGLHSIHGRHKKWFDEHGRLITVTQTHDQPSQGLIHAVYKEVVANSSKRAKE